MLPTTSRSALEGTGFEIIEQQQPSFLLAGSLLVTGEVDRTSGFERGLAIHQACRDGEWQPDPLILDDQALIANVAGKGLVVLTACGHAGVVNTVRYARRLTGEDRVHALVGGFHLNGPLFEPIIAPTCDALAELDPDYLVPTHCTGWRAIRRARRPLPQRLPASQRRHPIRVSQRLAASTHGVAPSLQPWLAQHPRSERAHAAEQVCGSRRRRGLRSRSARAGRRRRRTRRAHTERYGRRRWCQTAVRAFAEIVTDVKRDPRQAAALLAPRAGSVTEPPH